MTTELAPRPSEGAAWPNPLYQLTLAVAAASEPTDIFEAALDCLRNSLGVERSSVLLFDKDAVMRFKAWRHLSTGYRAAVEGHSPWNPDTVDAMPVLVEDVRLDASLSALSSTLELEGIKAVAFVPLTLGTRLLGKFMLYYDDPHVFSDTEVLTAQTIAAHVAFAIDQQEHRQSERRLRAILDSVGVALYTTDAEGRITFYNDEAAALWGRRPEIGVDLWCGSWRLYWSDGTPMRHDECPMSMTLAEGRSVRGKEAIAERPDGTRVNFIPYPTPLFDDAGRIDGAINVLVDITARKRAETALRHQETQLVAALAEQEQILAARDETIRLYEIVQAQLTSLIEASGALIDATDPEGAVQAILRIASGLLKADAHAMWRFIEERDQWEIVSSHGLSEEYIAASAIRDHDGQRYLPRELVVEDVHEEEQLSSLRERYDRAGIRSIFVAPLGIGDDTHGSLTFYYRAPHRFSDLEVRVGLALANLASASLTAARLFNENEQARNALRASNNELARTGDDLRSANAAKDEFLSLISHELKTPLTMIRGNAGVLYRSNGSLDLESRNAALADIVAESERLHRIIDNLLLLARTEQGQAPDSEPLLLVRIVERVVARHRQHNPNRRIVIEESDDPRPIVFSETCLEQVMENLISNAEKYSPPTEPIVIEFQRDDREVRTRVLDRGVGIASAEIASLFEPFYRSPKVRAEGLGIGLSVCKRLVEAHGGRMWAVPRSSGGSEFGFALPVSEDDLDA